MLILPIKRKWFDMILSGEKKEEYRDIKPYYDTRLMDAFGMIWVGDELIRAPMPELQKIASIILAVIMMGVLILAALPGNGAGIGIAMLITIIMALASGIIQLMAAVHFVPGFEIHGKLTYIILALLMAVFSIEEKKEA